jgi:hypothetical protein
MALPPVGGVVYVCAAFGAVARNPAPLVEDRQESTQTLELGGGAAGGYAPVVRFGLARDSHEGIDGMAYLLPWLHGGGFDHYGMFVRPRTPYDLRLRIDLSSGFLTGWVSGAGDDDWFLLAEEVELLQRVEAIDAVRVEQGPAAAGVRLVVRGRPWTEAQGVRPHPLAKADRVVAEDRGFRLQSMRSVWRRPGRHVTVARHNPETTPRERAWLGFPDVVQTGPTRLVCSYATGAAHGGGGDTVVLHSDDLGRTWGGPCLVHQGGVNCPRLQRLRDGSLLVVCDTHGEPYVVHAYRSRDGGHHWDAVGRLCAPEAGGHSGCVPSHVLELPDGAWLLVSSWAGSGPWSLERGELLEVYRSTDEGAGWQLHSVVAEPPRSLSEASLARAADGRIWLFAREAHGLLPGVKTFSDDGGRTWARLREMPFPMIGRTAVRWLRDGRLLSTCRAQVGRAGLWAWAGAPEEETRAGIVGAHFNDGRSVGLRDGALHIDNDGYRGQFTQYYLRGPDGPEGTVELTAEAQVVSNRGGAATLSIPYVGRLRLFSDRVALAHEPSVSAFVQPGRFHTYRVRAKAGRVVLWIDGDQAFDSSRADARTAPTAWSPIPSSPYVYGFGNEPLWLGQWNLGSERCELGAADWQADGERGVLGEGLVAIPPTLMLGMGVAGEQITPRVTGHSIWRRVESCLRHPVHGERRQSWDASRDGFPDQYQLDQVLEVDASIRGSDQGYSGWVELDDGRVFVVNYTDDAAPACASTPDWPTGLPWIRGTYLHGRDLQALFLNLHKNNALHSVPGF